MKFINRTREIELLKESAVLSKSKLFSVCLYGLRRVGKTRLILEILSKNDLYFFVNKDKTSQSLLKEYESSLKERGILTELESIESWEQFFKVLFERFNGIIAFDEFQNFINIDKSVYGILQKYIDLNEQKKGIFFIFSGSTMGLIKKLFEDSKEPLYGRVKRKMHLKPFPFEEVFKLCSELKISNFEEIIKLYSLFGGFPKYFVSIEDEKLEEKTTKEILERFFFMEDAVLEDEISQILSLEFGKRYGIYYDILGAIANGCTKISDIASFLRKKETALTRQIYELIDYFEIVGVENSVIGKKNLLFIRHPLMNFWFRFFHKNLSDYKRREPKLIEKIKNEIDLYVSRRFEVICQELINKIPPFNFTRIGRQWGKIPYAEKGENQYEIDIVALNEETKEILFGECKWKNEVNAEKIVKELAEKAKYVDWNRTDPLVTQSNRKESFAVFAKSFSKRIKEFEDKPVRCFDLTDLEKLIRKK